MKSSGFLKATAVASAVVATAVAASSSFTMSLSVDFFFSPVFLWVAANGIIWWLFCSTRATAASSDGDAHDDALDDGAGAVHDIYPSEYEGLAAVVPRVEAAAAVKVKRQPREARAGGRADRPRRVRKKSAGDGEAETRTDAVVVWEPAAEDRRRGEMVEVMSRAPVPAAEAAGSDDDEDFSLDTLWESIVQRRAARPVAVRARTWANHELPRLQREAETAVARRQLRKSASVVREVAPPPPPPAAAPQTGWRTRDVLLALQPDELLRRAESLIRRHHEHLKLQHQESSQRQARSRELQHGRPCRALVAVSSIQRAP